MSRGMFSCANNICYNRVGLASKLALLLRGDAEKHETIPEIKLIIHNKFGKSGEICLFGFH